MKIFFPVIFILLSNSVMAQLEQFGLAPVPKDIIYWSENRLTWADLKGNDLKGDKTNLRDRWAVIHATIHTSYGGRSDMLLVTVQAIFDRSTSAVSWGHENDHVLLHEQIHFDIYELFCRKIRKAISESGPFKPGEAGPVLIRIILENKKLCAKMQASFNEEETSDKKLEQWKYRIIYELNSLKAFQDPVAKVIVKY